MTIVTRSGGEEASTHLASSASGSSNSMKPMGPGGVGYQPQPLANPNAGTNHGHGIGNTNSMMPSAPQMTEPSGMPFGGLATGHLPAHLQPAEHVRRDSVLSAGSTGTTFTLSNSSNPHDDDAEDSEEEGQRGGEKRSGRRKIRIEYIEDKSRRHITFSKRKAGIMKKVQRVLRRH